MRLCMERREEEEGDRKELWEGETPPKKRRRKEGLSRIVAGESCIVWLEAAEGEWCSKQERPQSPPEGKKE